MTRNPQMTWSRPFIAALDVHLSTISLSPARTYHRSLIVIPLYSPYMITHVTNLSLECACSNAERSILKLKISRF